MSSAFSPGSKPVHPTSQQQQSTSSRAQINTVHNREEFIERISERLASIDMTTLTRLPGSESIPPNPKGGKRSSGSGGHCRASEPSRTNEPSRSREPVRSGGDVRTLIDKRVHNFKDVVKLLAVSLEYRKSGACGHTFRGALNTLNTSSIIDRYSDLRGHIAIKVVAYPKKERYGSLYDAARPENAELLILHYLSVLVMENSTPHLILPICTFYSNIRPFISIHDQKIVENKRYTAFVERFEKNDYYDNVSVLLSEWADRGDLLDYLRQNYKQMKESDWKVVVFQIISALASIHLRYPGFRHNDFKSNNILVQSVDRKISSFKYSINGKQYRIPNIGVQIKLWDFDFACIPGLVENEKVDADWTTMINIKPVQHQYYDIHYFFNTLRQKGFFPELFSAAEIPQAMKDFVLRTIPPEQVSDQVTKNCRILTDEEFTTPLRIIETDKWFREYRE